METGRWEKGFGVPKVTWGLSKNARGPRQASWFQGFVNFFYKGPDSKHVRHVGYAIFVTNAQLCPYGMKEIIDLHKYMEVAVFTIELIFEFHIIFTCHKILFFQLFSTLVKNVRAVPSWRATQNQAVEQIWPTEGTLPAPT